MNRTQGEQEPTLMRVDPQCIHSALKEFFQPLKTNDARADFFAIYRRESEEFDKENTKKYDEDLNTSLIFAGLFSAVSSAFVIDIQSKLEPDPNQLTVAYMQVLLHTLNGTLHPDVSLSTAARSGPGNEVIVVQCLLCASLSTSLFAAFVAMLGKQWLNRFSRHKGMTAAEKSWDRQNKLQGIERWRFRIVMESLPLILQFALFLFGCALSSYVWSLSHAVAIVVLSFTASGFAFYTFITIAGSIFYECPYQTPVSLITRAAVSRLPQHIPRAVAPLVNRFLWLLTLPVKNFRLAKSMIPGTPAFAPGTTRGPPTMDNIDVIPAPLFDGSLVDWSQHREDSKCVLWTVDASADVDVLSFAFRFAADIVWYPGIANLACISRLADLFLECFIDGEVIPGAEERAGHVARILASIFNIHACARHNLEAIGYIGKGILTLGWEHKDPDIATAWWFLTLTFHEEILVCPPLRKDASPAFCIWLSKMILQSVYWRQAKAKSGRYSIVWFGQPFEQILAGRKVPNAVYLNLVLACAVSLGLRLNISDLHMSDNSLVTLHTALMKLNEWMMVAIFDLSYGEEHIRVILRFLRLWGDPGFQDLAECCMSWIEAALDSGRPEMHKYRIARNALLVLDDYPGFSWFDEPIPFADDAHARVALRYLTIYHRTRGLDPTDSSLGLAAAVVALQIIQMECSDTRRPAPKMHLLDVSLVHTLTWAAENDPKKPLHFRSLALEIFTLIGGTWLLPWIDNVPADDRTRFINALGNVLDARDPTDGTPHPPTQLLLSMRMGVYEGDTFASRTGAFVHRSSIIFLVPLLFGLCSSWSWQASITKSAFSFVSYPSFEPDKWVVWLRHTLKMIANDGHLAITLLVMKLKELECYDVLALVIKSIWMSPDPGIVPPHLWAWVEQETVELFREPSKLGLAPLRGHLPMILDAYTEPSPDDTITTPYEAARSIFRCDEKPELRQSGEESYGRHSFEVVQRPIYWGIRQICMVKRLCQVLKRERDFEGLELLDLLRTPRKDRKEDSPEMGTSSVLDGPSPN